MIQPGKCKFCGKALALVIDDEYAKSGDFLGLVKMAACNPCADYQQEWSSICYSMRQVCVKLATRVISSVQGKADARATVEGLCKHYMRLIAERRQQPLPPFEQHVVDLIMEKPEDYAGYLKGIQRLFAQEALL